MKNLNFFLNFYPTKSQLIFSLLLIKCQLYGYTLSAEQKENSHYKQTNDEKPYYEPLPLPLSHPDECYNQTLDSFIFVSCCKQDKNYPEIANSIISHHANAFIWMGDAIYSKPPYPQGLYKGYEIAKANQDYSKIKRHFKIIDGTWDDHDFGTNDADGSFEFKDESQALYLDFLELEYTNQRRYRKGVYSSHLFGCDQPGNKKAKIILLDTRYHRDVWIFPSMSSFSSSPLMVILNGILRWLSGIFGLANSFPGDLLGEEQWLWFESQIMNSDCAFHVIVSSIQITTPISIVENWSHYPRSRKRFFDLIKKYKPNGVIFLSGDVHYAEILGFEKGILEVTSSGVTHSMENSLIMKLFFKYIIFPKYKQSNINSETVYGDKNFGLMKFQYETGEDKKSFQIDTLIYSIDNKVKLSTSQTFNLDDDLETRYNYFGAFDDKSPSTVTCATKRQVFTFLIAFLIVIIIFRTNRALFAR